MIDGGSIWNVICKLQCAEQQKSSTKYCACHEKSFSSLIGVTHETSFAMCGSIMTHPPKSPNTVAATKKAWNSDLTELYWPVTLLTELLRCCCTEQLLYGAVTWVSCCFTELFALLNLRNSEVSHLNFLWWRFGRFWVLYSIRFLWLTLPLLQKRLPGVLPLYSEFADRCFS